MAVPDDGTIRITPRHSRKSDPQSDFPRRMRKGLSDVHHKSNKVRPLSVASRQDNLHRLEAAKCLSGEHRRGDNRKETTWRIELRQCRWPRRPMDYRAQQPWSRWPELGYRYC